MSNIIWYRLSDEDSRAVALTKPITRIAHFQQYAFEKKLVPKATAANLISVSFQGNELSSGAALPSTSETSCLYLNAIEDVNTGSIVAMETDAQPRSSSQSPSPSPLFEENRRSASAPAVGSKRHGRTPVEETRNRKKQETGADPAASAVATALMKKLTESTRQDIQQFLANVERKGSRYAKSFAAELMGSEEGDKVIKAYMLQHQVTKEEAEELVRPLLMERLHHLKAEADCLARFGVYSSEAAAAHGIHLDCVKQLAALRREILPDGHDFRCICRVNHECQSRFRTRDWDWVKANAVVDLKAVAASTPVARANPAPLSVPNALAASGAPPLSPSPLPAPMDSSASEAHPTTAPLVASNPLPGAKALPLFPMMPAPSDFTIVRPDPAVCVPNIKQLAATDFKHDGPAFSVAPPTSANANQYNWNSLTQNEYTQGVGAALPLPRDRDFLIGFADKVVSEESLRNGEFVRFVIATSTLSIVPGPKTAKKFSHLLANQFVAFKHFAIRHRVYLTFDEFYQRLRMGACKLLLTAIRGASLEDISRVSPALVATGLVNNDAAKPLTATQVRPLCERCIQNPQGNELTPIMSVVFALDKDIRSVLDARVFMQQVLEKLNFHTKDKKMFPIPRQFVTFICALSLLSEEDAIALGVLAVRKIAMLIADAGLDRIAPILPAGQDFTKSSPHAPEVAEMFSDLPSAYIQGSEGGDGAGLGRGGGRSRGGGRGRRGRGRGRR